MAKKNDDLIEFFNATEIAEEMKNNKMNNEQKNKFIFELKEQWFLDNDNILFLKENDYDIFSLDQHLCFCLSEKLYDVCCKNKINEKKDKNYKSSYEALKDRNDWNKYLEWSTEFIKKCQNVFNKDRICIYSNCKNHSIKNNLYNFLDKSNYFTSVKENFLDIFSIMGSVFFNIDIENQFNFYSFCESCSVKFDFIEFDLLNNESLQMKKSYWTLGYKEYILKFKLYTLFNEYLTYVNSIKIESYKNLMIYQLKKIFNEYQYLLNLKKTFLKYFESEKKGILKVYKFTAKGKNNFICNDVILPSIIPNSYKTINSNNNIYVKPKMAIGFEIHLNDEKTQFVIVDSADAVMVEYFEYWSAKLKPLSRESGCFITNLNLINADNILLNKKWFNNLDNNDKIVISTFHKIRFDSPKNGKDMFVLQMLSNIDKGFDFFNF